VGFVSHLSINTSANKERAWVFQANPEKYDILTSLQQETREYWNLRQHWRDVKIGDGVYIWLSGPDAGIYATGVVLNQPELRPDSAKGQTYWNPSSEGRKERKRVLVEYRRRFISRPLFRRFLVHDPDLSQMPIIVNPRGTNFALSTLERDLLEGWLNDL
jgi:predicted RNA-binding protein with PUA-like domain